MKGKIFLVCFACITFLLVSPGCKNLLGPDQPSKTHDIVEFMYERTLPIVDNNSTDTKGFSIWNKDLGGKTVTQLTYLGNDQWMGEAYLFYSTAPYWIYTVDGKVMGDVWGYVAETFYARIQGSSEWVKLTCIEVEPTVIEGLAAKFYLDDKGIRVP